MHAGAAWPASLEADIIMATGKAVAHRCVQRHGPLQARRGGSSRGALEFI